MAENLERTKMVRYELFSKALGLLILDQEPRGYDNDTRSYNRDKDSRGILIKTKIKLEFFGEGAEYLTTLSEQKGISEKVLLTKYVRDTKSLYESWKFRYIQELDMGKYKFVSRQRSVTVDATEGGLFSDVNNRKSDKYDILTNESADGINIGDLNTRRFIPTPRGIFRQSLLRGTNKDNNKDSYRLNSQRAKNEGAFIRRAIPLTEVYNYDTEDVIAPWNSDISYNDLVPHSSFDGFEVFAGNQFVYQAEIQKILKIKIDLTFKISGINQHRVTNKVIGVDIIKTELANNVDMVSSRRVLLNVTSPQDHIGEEYTVSYESDDEGDIFEIGDSMSFCLFSTANLNGSLLTNDAFVDVFFSVTNSQITIQDKTDYDVTEGKCLKPFDLFERLIAKMTGINDSFKSTIFGPGGKYENFVVDNGFWARGFPDVEIDADGNEDRIQFNTSFKEAYEAYNYLEPLTWFIEVEGNKEVVRIEEATYTMKNFVGLVLPSVDNITHQTSKIDFFSNITIGHNKSLEYDDANGIEEPNGKSEFVTHIKRSESKYIILSAYRFDPIGYETTRRKYHYAFPKTDTERDSHIWMHDTKVDNNGIHTHNLWEDLDSEGNPFFEYAPKGIFDPETAWNLRLSPMNRLFYGHGYSVKRGLYHFRNAKIRFASSNSNQNMITQRTGEIELAESGNIVINAIEKPRIEATISNLNFRMTQEIEDTLLDFTEVNGEKVPNYFGLIQYTENGDLRYGRLSKLDGDSESELTTQKARL